MAIDGGTSDHKTLVDHWTSEIDAGKAYRKKYSTEKMWPEWRKMYRGIWPKNIVPVNRIFSFGRALIPRVYFRIPRVVVTATHPSLEWHARVVESLDNMLIRETLLKKTLKRGILDSYLSGVGPIKLGYDSEFGFLPDQATMPDNETVTQVGVKSGDRIEYQAGVKPGMPWALRVMPEDLVVPWGTQTADNLPWVAHRVVRPLDDVREDQKYIASARRQLKGNRIQDVTKKSGKPRGSDEALFCELEEVRDWKTKQIMVFCEDQLLMSAPDALQFFDLPWEFIQFNEDPEYFWSIPDVAILDPQQRELNEARTQASMHRRIALIKFLYKRNAISKTELDRFLSGDVGPAVAVDEVEVIANAIHILQPHVPSDLYSDMNSILNDMREELGFSANQLGEFSAYHGKTATESSIVDQAFAARADERKDTVADTLVNIVQKWNQMIFRFWTEEKVTRIVSPQGEPFWVKYTGDQLEGQYLLHLDVESGIPMTRAMKYEMAKDLQKVYGGDPLIDQMKLRQIVLSHYAQVEPLAAELVREPEGGLTPQMVAGVRQPNPMMPGGSGGSPGGSRGGRPAGAPAALDSLKSRG